MPPLVSILFAWALLFAPGRLVLGSGSGLGPLPPLFAAVLASAVVTTVVATLLAAWGNFSLGAVLVGNAVVASIGLAMRTSASPTSGSAGLAESNRDRLGPAIAVVALLAWWPAWPSFLGASDSTAYVGTGVSLARHGHLWRDDELGPLVPPIARPILFDSMSQVFASGGPPYRRMPGAMLLHSLDDRRAWPAFFPVPSVWAALFVCAGFTGSAIPEMAAPGYAPVFAALALWAFSLLARAWLGSTFGLLAVLLLAASGPWVTAARLPLSEPIAAFFTLGALATLAVAIPRRPAAAFARPAPAWTAGAALAGAAFGAAVFTRVETALWLAMALALAPTFDHGRRLALPMAFYAAFAVLAALAVVEAALIPGMWVSPLLDHLSNAWLRWNLTYGLRLLGPAALAAAAGLAMAALLARRVGWSAVLRWLLVGAVVCGHAYESRFLADRTPMWLSFFVGWSGLALAAVGLLLARRHSDELPAAGIVLGSATAVALLLFYNPHVHPTLPWGARRFVPVLLPMIVLLATWTARCASRRSRLAGLACVAVLAWPVWLGGRPVWDLRMMDGAWEALAAIDAAVPRGGTILYDRDVSPMMVGPAMWLVHDRNGIGVPPTANPVARKVIPGLVWNLARRGPVYLVTRAAGGQLPLPLVAMTQTAIVPVTLPFIEQTYDRRPERRERYAMPIAVYRLEPSGEKRGIIHQ